MKIRLENFRGVVNRIYEIPDNLITSISGPSGVGKSTLFEAILFGFFDLKSNIYPKNTSSNLTTSVSIITKELNLIRTKRPNALRVRYKGQMFVDSQAQAVINKIYGTKDLWEMTSYIPQGHDHLFIGMSSAKKNDIISEIAMQGHTDVSDLISKVDNNLFKLKKSHENLTVDYRATQKMLDLIRGDHKTVEDVEDLIRRIRELEEKRKDLRQKYYLLRDERTKAVDMSEKTKTLNIRDELKEKDINQLKDKLSFLSDKLSMATKYSKEREELKQLTSCPLEEPISEELLENLRFLDGWSTSDLDKNRNLLLQWDLYESGEEYKSLKEKRQIALKVKEDLKEVNLLSEVSKLRQKSVKCPTCQSELFFNGHELSHIRPEADNYSISDFISKVQEMKKIEDLERTIENLDLALSKFDNKEFPETKPTPSRQVLEYRIMQDEEKLKIYEKTPRLNYEEELRKFKSWRRVNELREILKSVPEDNEEDLRKEFKSLNEDISQLETYNLIRTTKSREVKEIEGELDSLLQEDKTLVSEMKMLDSTIKSYKKAVEFRKQEEKANDIRAKVSLVAEDISACNTVKIAITTSAADMMNSFLHKLNSICNEVLSLLFEEPVTLKIDSFTKLKTQDVIKPQISIEIYFKGNTYIGFSGLSGGERSRISVALLIAFSKLKGTKIILLDEVMSTLDSETKNRILEVIRQYLKGKTVMIINHDTNDSLYDNVLNI